MVGGLLDPQEGAVLSKHVQVVHWNPQKPVLRGPLARFGPSRPVNNFGDLLGPVVVQKLLQNRGIKQTDAVADRRLLAVGSILRLAKDDDVVWGIGANGKSLDLDYGFDRLDVRAVRGPLTRAFLRERGHSVPEVYGDPGLLVGHFWSRSQLQGEVASRDVVVVPNFHDFRRTRDENVVNPRGELWSVLARIASSRLVVGSSLHAIIVAESLGIPARLVQSHTEPAFKYDDYFQGTGRARAEPAESVADAIRMGGQRGVEWDPKALLDAFPWDLWQR